MDSLRDLERDSVLRDALRSAGRKGILAWYPEDIVMLTGSHSCFGMDLCLYPTAGKPIFYAPHGEPEDALPPGFTARRFTPQPLNAPAGWEELGQLLRLDLEQLGIGTGGLGIAFDSGLHAVPTFQAETPPLTYSGLEHVFCSGEIRDARGVFSDLAQVKTQAEIDAIRRANQVAGEEVNRAARSILEERGYGAGFTLNCGRHVGFRYHDRGPVLQPGSRFTLKEGMILTIEPGSYGSGFGGGARFEDDVLVGPNGAEILSPIHVTSPE